MALRVRVAFRIAYVRHVRNKRMLKFEEQFPEAIDLLARALRAGHALTTGLQHGGRGAAAADRRVSSSCCTISRTTDLPLPQALRNFAERIPSLDARFFVTAV